MFVEPGTSAGEALAVMARTGFSQLPIIAGRTVIGVFSYRSFATKLHHVRRQDDPYMAPVDDFCEDLEFVRASAEVEDVLVALDRDGAILVGDEGNLLAVATSSDLLGVLWRSARPFFVLQEIELAIRDLIKAACPSTKDLSERVAKGGGQGEWSGKADLHELTLGELLSVLLNRDNYRECFHRTFGPNRDLINSTLSPTRDVRNKIVHFRGDVTDDEMESLLAARRLMLRKVLTVKAL